MSKWTKQLILQKMIDDKGNRLFSGDIVIDTNRFNEGVWEYWLVLDRDTCIKLHMSTDGSSDKPVIKTLAKLKNDGYIKRLWSIKQIVRESL